MILCCELRKSSNASVRPVACPALAPQAVARVRGRIHTGPPTKWMRVYGDIYNIGCLGGRPHSAALRSDEKETNMKRLLFAQLTLFTVLASLGIPVATFADSTVDTKPAPSAIKSIADLAGDISGYYSTAKTVFEVTRALGNALGLIQPDDANAKFNALHEHLNTVAAGINLQQTKTFIDSQRGLAIAAITELQRDPEMVRPLDDAHSAIAAETFVLGGPSFRRPYDEKVTDGEWSVFCKKAVKYTKQDLLPEDGGLVYEWRLGIPGLLEVISYRLQFIAAKDPNFRNDNKYDAELQRYRGDLITHRDKMLRGIKCGVPPPPTKTTPIWIRYRACADIRTGIAAIEWDDRLLPDEPVFVSKRDADPLLPLLK